MTSPPEGTSPGQRLDGDTSAVLAQAAWHLHRVRVTRSIGLSNAAAGSDHLHPGQGALRDVLISAAARDGILDAVQATLDAVQFRTASQMQGPSPVLEAVSQLCVELRRYPRTSLARSPLAESSPGEMFRQQPESAPARDWAQAWRAVTIATTDILLTLDRPQPGAQEPDHPVWAAAADLAAIAGVIPVLDHDLADHLAPHTAPLPLSTTELVHLAPAEDREVVRQAVVRVHGQALFAAVERNAHPELAEASQVLRRHHGIGHGLLEPAAARLVHAVDAAMLPAGYDYRPRPAAPWTVDHEPQRVAPIRVQGPQDLADALVWSQRMLAVDQPLTRTQHGDLAHVLAVTAHQLHHAVSDPEVRDALIAYRDAHRGAAVYWTATDIVTPGPGDERTVSQLSAIVHALPGLDLPDDIARAAAAHLPALSQAVVTDVRSWPGLDAPRTAVNRQLAGLATALDRVADHLHRALDHAGEAAAPTPPLVQPTARDLLVDQASQRDSRRHQAHSHPLDPRQRNPELPPRPG